MQNFNLGIIADPRSEEEKAKDYPTLAGNIPIEWKEKPEWKTYTPRDQSTSLSCVAQAAAKGGEILGEGILSAQPIYRRRFNFPSGGMWPQNCGDIFKNQGTTTEALCPSQYQGEALMNRDVTVDTPIRTRGYAFPKPKDIDEIAQAIELHGHCMLLIRCNRMEWTAIPPILGGEINFHHEVTAVDYFIKDGKKYILIEDSTGHFNSYDGKGQRLLSEDFIKARSDHAMYLIKNLAEVPYVFTKTLRRGSRGLDVKMLQLKLGGLVADGIFGPKTDTKVREFQRINRLVVDGIVGPKTNAVLNR
jgi:hypothetical protein